MHPLRAPRANLLAALAVAAGCVVGAGPRTAAAQAAAPQVTVYRCIGADGEVTLRDTPCAKGERQETREMVRPADAPPARAPVADAGRAAAPAPAAPRVVIVRQAAPTPMYECTTPDNTTYTSDSREGNPRWVPMWTLGWPVPAGTWVRDTCRAMPQAETCARLRDRRDGLERRFFNAMPSERARIELEERSLDARLDADCGGR
jgi:hypothetical protein